MTTIKYRFTVEKRDDGAYVTTFLDDHAIATHGPMAPRLTGQFVNQAKRWVDKAFERLIADALSQMNSTVEDPQWPPDLIKRMWREDHPPHAPKLPPYVRAR